MGDKSSELKPIAEVEESDYFKLTKGLGKFPLNSERSKIPNWNLLNEDVSLPAAVLSIPNYEHNLEWMQNFVDHYGFQLAPHGKTTLCPQLFKKQIQKGSWGMTLATAAQVNVAHAFGITQVLMANQLIGIGNMEIISKIQEKDSQFKFSCIVDSTENVRALGKYFKNKNQTLRILLELGVEGGRTGIRDNLQEELIIKEIRQWSSLKLIGIEFYEGILTVEDSVRQFIQRAIRRTQELAKLTAFDEFNVILSGSGSAWFDIVAQEFSNISPLKSPYKLNMILRPGCYVTHGSELYNEIDNRLTIKNPIDGAGLMPALTIWAYVQSMPQPNLIIIGMGKRDVLNDCGFPVPHLLFRPEIHTKPERIQDGWHLNKMMDQHSFMIVPDKADIKIGDIIIFNICHPCTALDKWRHILAVNENYIVQDIFDTYF